LDVNLRENSMAECPVCHVDHSTNPTTTCDYEACGYCGFDHAYEAEQAMAWHLANPCSYCRWIAPGQPGHNPKTGGHEEDCCVNRQQLYLNEITVRFDRPLSLHEIAEFARNYDVMALRKAPYIPEPDEQWVFKPARASEADAILQRIQALPSPVKKAYRNTIGKYRRS
jgi:hypothetical protein